MGLLNGTAQQYYGGNDFGNYQFTSLNDIINQFMLIYIGEDKIISKAKRLDVAFHAQRALAELSFDTFKSCKAQEITVPASLQMILPQDYVNYTKISTVDSAGIKHLLYPTSKTSNPTSPYQNSVGDFSLSAVATFPALGIFVIPLDGQYDNISIGMEVWSPTIQDFFHTPGYVYSTSLTNGITSIIVFNGNYVTPVLWEGDVSGISTGQNEKLTFRNTSGDLVKTVDSVTLENCSFGFEQNFITAAANSGVKIGMKVSNIKWNVGPSAFQDVEVVDVQGTHIILNKNNFSAGAPGTSVTFIGVENISDTWSNYKSGTPPENQDDYQDDTYWPMDGSRYGLDPQHAQANGSFYIDCVSGKIHFSSNVSGKTVVLDYISDSLGTDGEMQVHKFAEEAMYKWISHAILAGRSNIPEYQVNRFKKERFAAIRTAKLRLSNIKLEEITQIMRGKSKQIKH